MYFMFIASSGVDPISIPILQVRQMRLWYQSGIIILQERREILLEAQNLFSQGHFYEKEDKIAWEPPYAMGAAVEKTKKKKKRGRQNSKYKIKHKKDKKAWEPQ